jgi:hypothetical protein
MHCETYCITSLNVYHTQDVPTSSRIYRSLKSQGHRATTKAVGIEKSKPQFPNVTPRGPKATVTSGTDRGPTTQHTDYTKYTTSREWPARRNIEVSFDSER